MILVHLDSKPKSISENLLQVPKKPTAEFPLGRSVNSYQSPHLNTKVTHVISRKIPEVDVQLQSSLYPYNIAVESEKNGGEGIFVFPNVADLVG